MKIRFWLCLILSAAMLASIGCGHKKGCCQQSTGFSSPGSCCQQEGAVLPPVDVPAGY